MSYCTGFLKSIFSGFYHLFFFIAYCFKTILEALEMIVLPAPPYNPYQQLFVKKKTDYPRVIGQRKAFMAAMADMFLEK